MNLKLISGIWINNLGWPNKKAKKKINSLINSITLINSKKIILKIFCFKIIYPIIDQHAKVETYHQIKKHLEKIQA